MITEVLAAALAGSIEPRVDGRARREAVVRFATRALLALVNEFARPNERGSR